MNRASDPGLAETPGRPERLGIYRIEALLGRGGMGEVYLAWDELLERHVAIKRVASGRLGAGSDGGMARARFLREARAVARLDHPSIVRIYHVLERDDGDCLVMEYVRGQELSRLVGRTEMGLARAVAVGRDIAEGLAAAHGAGLVHRDLKLANVMVNHEGQVKILDFGLAKALGAPLEGLEATPRDGMTSTEMARESEDELTRGGALVGTVHAMSPEQASGLEVDHRSDLFALGSLLYELLTGESPFRAANPLETLRRVVTIEPEPIAYRVPEVDGELAGLITELLAKEKARRPASARQVASRLGRIARQLAPGTVHEAVSGRGPIPRDVVEVSGPAAADLPTAVHPSTARIGPEPVVRVLLRIDCAAGSAAAVEAMVRQDSGRYDLREAALGRPSSLADGPRLFPRLFPWLFPWFFYTERPAEAVAFALTLQRRLAETPGADGVKVGIHLDEILLSAPSVTGSLPRIEGPARERVEALASRARAGQILLGRAAFDLARGASAPTELRAPEVRWLAHGAYVFGESDEPFEVFEVGLDGLSPLREPSDSAHTRREVARGEEIALGWRPAVGQEVPRRDGWQLTERLGEGGFGEVWLARHGSGEERVFKFCFEAERLRALEREVTLFRLLRETLGHRRDIARVLAWDFERAPYFLESEYTGGGDLVRWAERRGGLATVPLATRLELVAQVAEALAAAHSVGVLHKDVKPRNILVDHDADGRPQAQLSDFGIGLLTRREALDAPGFTVLGFSESTLDAGQTRGGGTVQYMAPELLAGQPATTQADLYSLGVVLYQSAVGDFGRVLAPGWRRDLDDALLVEDIAACVDGSPERRLRGPAELAERLRSLDARRAEQQAEERATAVRARSLRRRRIAGWLGLASAVLLVVVSVFAYQTSRAKNRELEARRHAEQRKAQAEALIDFLLGDLRRELQPIGKLDILDKVGDRAMDYFATVDEEALSDEEIALYAKALHQIGQVRFSLGKISEATEAFREALTMARRLAARDPGHADWQFELGQSHFWLGFLRWKERDLDAALGQFQEYREISRQLVERDPSKADWQLELAYSQSNLGQVREERGELGPASEALEASIEIFEELVAGDPGDSEDPGPETTGLSVEMAHVVAKLGQVLYRRGELGESTERFRSALAMYQRAAEGSSPIGPMWVRIGMMHEYIGRSLALLGEGAAAVGALETSLDIAGRLAKHDSENTDWQEILARRHDRLGLLFLALGRPETAHDHFEKERAILVMLRDQEPDHLRWRAAEARNRCSSAVLALEEGEPREAVTLAGSCRTLLEAFVESSSHRLYRFVLARAYWLLGEARRALGDALEAEQAWRAGTEWARPLIEQAPDPIEIDLWVRLLLRSGREQEAEPWREKLSAMGYREPDDLALLDAGPRARP